MKQSFGMAAVTAKQIKQIKGNLSIMPDTQKGSKGQNTFATRRANNQKEQH